MNDVNSCWSDQNMALLALTTIMDLSETFIYWKDLKGVYRGVNRAGILGTVKLGSPSEILGKTDYDLFPKKVADKFTQHDQEVLRTLEEHKFQEKLFFNPQIKIYQISIKRPLFDTQKAAIGIIGFTDRLNILTVRGRSVTLSEREIEAISYLCRSLTTDKIGYQMYLSKRTVESHWENIKNKLSVTSRSELVKILGETGTDQVLMKLFPVDRHTEPY